MNTCLQVSGERYSTQSANQAGRFHLTSLLRGSAEGDFTSPSLGWIPHIGTDLDASQRKPEEHFFFFSSHSPSLYVMRSLETGGPGRHHGSQCQLGAVAPWLPALSPLKRGF